MLRSSLAFVLVAACASPQDPPAATAAAGPIARSIEAAAVEAGVPADLALALAIEEGGTQLAPVRSIDADDNVPVAGAFELRHGRLDTLALGAQLMNTTTDALVADTALGTRAGARVLAQLGRDHGAGATLESWRGALEAMSGMDDTSARDYASRVLERLRTGDTATARAGEILTLAAHPEIAPSVMSIAATTPDFPGAIWFTTSCTNKCTAGRPLGNASVNKIVIHDTEGGWNASVATLQFDSGKSVHYIIDADGSRVGQFRPETDTTWHAGNYYYNETSIGIEHVGVASDPAGYAAGLYTKSRALVKSIRTRWNVPLDRRHIVGHYQIPNGNNIAEDSAACADQLDTCETSPNYGGAGNHRDPGYNWQWCEYMEALGGSCTCNDTWDHWNCTTDKTEAWRCTNGQLESAQCANGCDVMPVGQDDVCHTAATDPGSGSGSGSDTGSGSGSGSGSDYANPNAPGDHAGCAAGGTGGSGSLVLALGMLLATRRRRR